MLLWGNQKEPLFGHLVKMRADSFINPSYVTHNEQFITLLFPIANAPRRSLMPAPCTVCGQDARLKCSRCTLQRAYCGSQCQRSHFKTHRAECQRHAKHKRANDHFSSQPEILPGLRIVTSNTDRYTTAYRLSIVVLDQLSGKRHTFTYDDDTLVHKVSHLFVLPLSDPSLVVQSTMRRSSLTFETLNGRATVLRRIWARFTSKQARYTTEDHCLTSKRCKRKVH